ncbi:MAG TPA: sensor histidine kinase [Micromonosporaceae bacterium]
MITASGLGTRLERMPRLLRALWAGVRSRPFIGDTCLVLLLLLISHPTRFGAAGVRPPEWSWLLIVGLVVPLIWRRRAPFLVFLLVATVALVQWFARELIAADLAPLVAFYTVATYESRRRIAVAAGILEIGAVMAAIRFGPANNQIWAFVFISVLVAASGLIGYNIRTRRAYLAGLEDRAARLERERGQEAQLAAAAERSRIAREMHDVVAHNIAVMIALAEGAAYTNDTDPGRATTIMGQVSGTGRAALAEMRRLLGVMRDPASSVDHAPQPTIGDLDELVATVRAAGLPTRLSITGATASLPPSAQLAIYRMVQEALTNTLKHASASRADVRLSCRPEEVDLEITNDGLAIAPTSEIDGHGIAGMRERAAVFGGQVEVGPGPSGGWRVRTRLHVAAA